MARLFASGWPIWPTHRCFRVDAETFRRVRENFSADSVDNATCLATIREVLDAHDYLLDPHTAVAYAAAQNLRGENPVLIASTAHWAKFGNNVYRAIHGIEPSGELPADVAALTGCELNKLIAEETDKHHIPAGLANLEYNASTIHRSYRQRRRGHRGRRRGVPHPLGLPGTEAMPSWAS